MIGNSKLGGNQFAVWLRSGLCGQVQGWGPELGGRIPVATGRPCVINGVHECPFADTATLLKAGSEGLHQPPSSALDTGSQECNGGQGEGGGGGRGRQAPSCRQKLVVMSLSVLCQVTSVVSDSLRPHGL